MFISVFIYSLQNLTCKACIKISGITLRLVAFVNTGLYHPTTNEFGSVSTFFVWYSNLAVQLKKRGRVRIENNTLINSFLQNRFPSLLR